MADRINDRDGRDAAGIGPYDTEPRELVPMSSLGWKVSKGEPDIRGWEVRTISGRKLGTVRDLMVDAKAGEVVQLDVDLAGTSRHTLVPIRIVQVDRKLRVVLMDSADLPADAMSGSEADLSVTDEVMVVRRPVADDVQARAADSAIADERRRGERRRIDRMGTDI